MDMVKWVALILILWSGFGGLIAPAGAAGLACPVSLGTGVGAWMPRLSREKMRETALYDSLPSAFTESGLTLNLSWEDIPGYVWEYSQDWVTYTAVNNGGGVEILSSGSGDVTFFTYSIQSWWEHGDTIHPTYGVQNNKWYPITVKVRFLIYDWGWELTAENTVTLPAYGYAYGSWNVHTKSNTWVGFKTVILQIKDAYTGLLYQELNLGDSYYIQTFNPEEELAGWTPTTVDPFMRDDIFHSDPTLRRIAAAWADNTGDVASAAHKLTIEVWAHFIYWGDWGSLNFAFSDLYILTHPNPITGHYMGVCDEYAIFFTSLARHLRIPTHLLHLTFYKNGVMSGAHAVAEVWDSSSWIHCDPTWCVFNNPQIYKAWGYATDVEVRIVREGRDHWCDLDPTGDGWLLWSGIQTYGKEGTDFTHYYLGWYGPYN